jgi:hypothetical protein
MPTPKYPLQDNQSIAEATCKEAEAHRRERPTMHTTPLPADFGIPDYGASGQVMENAMAHLRESIPNGQRRRTELAFFALRRAIVNHEAWLRAMGYNV